MQALKTNISEAIFLEVDSISDLEIVLKQNSDADLLLMDLHMPGANGFVGLAHVVKHFSHLPVMMISADENISIAANAKKYGALGFIAKSASIKEISTAIETVMQGELSFPIGLKDFQPNEANHKSQLVNKIAELTPKQFEVFNLLAYGLLNKQIAYKQHVTEATVKAHVTAIMRKLNVNNRTQIVMIANEVKVEEFFGNSVTE